MDEEKEVDEEVDTEVEDDSTDSEHYEARALSQLKKGDHKGAQILASLAKAAATREAGDMISVAIEGMGDE